MKQVTILLYVSIALSSCNKLSITPPPVVQDTSLANTFSLPDSLMHKMEGIYVLASGSGSLGSEFVCKVSKSKVSFFGNSSGIFFILDYGFQPKDSSIHFAGFWRYSENSTQGSICLSAYVGNSGSDLLLLPNKLLKLSGSFSGNGAVQNFTLRFERAFSVYAIEHELMLFAHHGVQTTDNPPYTENSLNEAIHAQEYGVNGLEFDVHLTGDHTPICVHDASISARVTEKGPLTGNYIQYSFAFIDSFIKLSDGEKIPSVEQVLDAFIDSTTLKYMWLDVKGDPGIFQYLDSVVRRAYTRASKANRKVIIFADLSSSEVIAEFRAWPDYSSLPTICETSLADVFQYNCQYWGPRYSLGLLLDDVSKAHLFGKKVLSWTLNDEGMIRYYLENGRFDGFITDYPAYAVHDFYTMF